MYKVYINNMSLKDQQTIDAMTAATTVASAASNAATTVAAAAAAANATVNSDISYIKRDVSEIKQGIKELSGVFATKIEINEMSKIQVDHETRIRGIETNVLKWTGAIGVLAVVLSVIISYVLKII